MNPEQVDQDLRKIMKVAAVLMIFIGALIIWRGITKMIPLTGIVNGGLFTLGGAFIVVLGILFLAVPAYKDKKKAEKAAQEQQAENTDNGEQ